MMETLQNEAVDIAYDDYKASANVPDAQDVDLVFRNTGDQKDPMRLLLTTHWALLLTTDNSSILRHGARKEVMEKNGEIGFAVVDQMTRFTLRSGRMLKPLGIVGRCRFHSHTTTKETPSCNVR